MKPRKHFDLQEQHQSVKVGSCEETCPDHDQTGQAKLDVWFKAENIVKDKPATRQNKLATVVVPSVAVAFVIIYWAIGLTLYYEAYN